MTSSAVRIRALLAVACCVCLVGCGERQVDTYWFGDAESAGATVWVGGQLVAVLTRVESDSSALVALPVARARCASGDTIARSGERRLSQHVRIPRGDHNIIVIGGRRDTLRCRARIEDSPVFCLYSKCGMLFYPGPGGQGFVRLGR